MKEQAMNLKQKIVLIIMDMVILTEMVYSLYLGSLDQQNIAGVFLRNYIPALILTVLVGRYLINKLRANEIHENPV